MVTMGGLWIGAIVFVCQGTTPNQVEAAPSGADAGFRAGFHAELDDSFDDSFDDDARPFLKRYCFACHGGEHVQGGLDLSRVESSAEVRRERDTWEWLATRVGDREMPPRGEVAPDEAERAAFLVWLNGALAEAEARAERDEPAQDAGSASPGRPAMRRLTRRAYGRAVRDLFGVEFDAAGRFPSDPIGYGFEGVGEAQSLSDAEVELYIEAAEAVAALAIVVDPPGPPPVKRFGPERLDGAGASQGDTWNLFVAGAAGAELVLPRVGRYRVRAGVHADQAGREPARLRLSLGAVDGPEIAVDEPSGVQRIVEAELDVTATRGRAAVRFVNDFWDPLELDESRRDRNLHVHWIEVVGPLDALPPSPFLVELTQAAEGEAGRERLRAALAHLVRRVWRRPATQHELGRLEQLIPSEAPFAARMRDSLAAALASPHFLFLVEGLEEVPAEGRAADTTDTGAEAARPLTDAELAARLAFALWVSVPDAELDGLADSGGLRAPDALTGQIERLLADRRSEGFSEAFALPWLHLGPLAGWTVDEKTFPEFDQGLRRSMLDETRRVLRRHVTQDLRLADLLLGTHTFVDERLAAHYGVPFEGEGGKWREVDLSATGRRGLLGHASVLTVTSEPTRTSPVKRGKWVLEVLLGSPPPPPPPGVDSLEAGPGADPTLPLRERLALHRTDPNCAACHTRMDPLGFGLEGFDAIGRARNVDIDLADEADPSAPRRFTREDMTGRLPDGRQFTGAVELVELLQSEGLFARQVTERLFVYSLGRPLERADRVHVDAALAAAGPDPSLRGLIRAVVQSRPFGWIARQSVR